MALPTRRFNAPISDETLAKLAELRERMPFLSVSRIAREALKVGVEAMWQAVPTGGAMWQGGPVVGRGAGLAFGPNPSGAAVVLPIKKAAGF